MITNDRLENYLNNMIGQTKRNNISIRDLSINNITSLYGKSVGKKVGLVWLRVLKKECLCKQDTQ